MFRSLVPWATLALVLGWCGSAIGQSSEPAQDSGRYTVGVADVLRVEAYQHTEISGDFPVEVDGTIQFPFIGAVHVAGLTTTDISHLIESRLEKDYYVDVQLQVEVKEYRSRPVTVLGEVQRPGTYYLEGRTTLTQLIAEAGGLRPTAGPTVELRRLETVDGVVVQNAFNFDTDKLLRGEEGREVELQIGDVVSVQSRQLFFVTGEVSRPGQYELSPGLTLMQALSQAGGQSKFASQDVELHRDQQGGKEILEFDLSEIRKGKLADPPIKPGDVVIVKRRFF